MLQTHLALYCFAGGLRPTALRLLYRARYLTLIVSGDDHPHIVALDVSQTADPDSKSDVLLLFTPLLSSASERAGPRSSRSHGARAVADIPEERFTFNLEIPRPHVLTVCTMVRVSTPPS